MCAMTRGCGPSRCEGVHHEPLPSPLLGPGPHVLVGAGSPDVDRPRAHGPPWGSGIRVAPAPRRGARGVREGRFGLACRVRGTGLGFAATGPAEPVSDAELRPGLAGRG